MKTHLLAMSATISTLSMLTACGGGSGSPSFSGPFAPTVYVTAKSPVDDKVIATAKLNTAFTIEWSSTGSTSCVADFDSGTGTSGSVSKTETTSGTKTYTVTCTGAGGSATNSAIVEVSAAFLPEGLWQGSLNNNSAAAVSGVITKEGDYWLVYARPSDSKIVGFYAGNAVSVETAPPAGTFSSLNLREVNFDTGFTGGNTAAGNISPGSYSSKQSVSGTFNPTAGSSSHTLLTFNPVTETGSSTVHTQTASSTATLSDTGVLTITGTGNFFDSVGLGVNDQLNVVEIYNGTISGTTWTASGTGSYQFSNCQIVAGPNFCGLIPTTAASFTSASGSINLASTSPSTLTAGFTMIVAGGPVPVSVIDTLENPTSASIPSITAGTFALSTYNSAYETAAALSAVAGSYTTGSTGIDATMNADASLTVASDGSITGTESVSHCNYTATLAPHATGNVYDVTALTFFDNGGTCVYTLSGAFTGVATYDDTTKQLTLTALNATRDKGFMVIATQP